jgi:hypothetical protein
MRRTIMSATITLKEYLSKKKTFVVPEYQRGYVWGKARKIGEKDSVTYILDDIINKFDSDRERDIFLQGVTVCEKDREIVLIDGQQRTTFLRFFLKELGYAGKFDIRYAVRNESDKFLNESIDFSGATEDQHDEYQDIFFFKKTLRLIREKLTAVNDKAALLDFLLSKVKFLYINIPDESEAMKVFTMMNGSRAQMTPEEVIKAELLRLVSLGDVNDGPHDEEWLSREWECNAVRGRYAREWDKWLQWWNRDDVRKLYRCENVMGLLVSSYVQLKKGEALSLETFKSSCLGNSASKDAAAIAFEGLRKIQKHFEDAFSTPRIHNLIGLVFQTFAKEKDRASFVSRYFVAGKTWELETYVDVALLGLTSTQCGAIADAVASKTLLDEGTQKALNEKYEIAYNSLSDDFLYLHDKEFAMKWLLRLNMYEDSELERFFDFRIWTHRSLEHICPKSRVGHKEEERWVDGNDEEKTEKDFYLKREDIKKAGGGSEHGIGNLVLLYKDENSAFGSKDFGEKKEMFFNPKNGYKSRHLIHTVSVFAGPNTWDEFSIANNRMVTLNGFSDVYKRITEAFNEE